MSVIVKKVRFRGSKGSLETPALFDRGASYSCIRPDVVRRLATIEPLPQPVLFATAKGGVAVRARHVARLEFYLGNDRFSDEFMVIDGLSDPVIIGAKTMQSWRMRLDFERDEIVYPKVSKLRIVRAVGDATCSTIGPLS